MAATQQIHIVNSLGNAAGGSEWRAVELFRELSPHAEVRLWSEGRPDPDLIQSFPIHKIDADLGVFPRGGTLIFVGVYDLPGTWIALARPRRVIVLYNTFCPTDLKRFMRHVFAQQVPRIEVVYASEALRERTKLRGTVEPSLIDLNRFQSAESRARNSAFTVGRLSRNDPQKHHSDDLELYRQLAAAGCRVRIMGGKCLEKRRPIPQGVELLPTKSERAEEFLQKLDCFFYRTSETIWETFGRVVHEAMACGLPVVCHRRGGYVASIDHERNGFLFDTNEEALEIIRRLQDDPALRVAIGEFARATVEQMYSAAERQKIIEYYLA